MMGGIEKSKADYSGKPQMEPSGKRWGGWWIYLLPLLILLYPVFFDFMPAAKEITWQQFENNLLNRRAVEKIVIVNNEKAEVYLKKEFANDSMFKDVFKPLMGEVNNGPHYSFTIGSVESFERKLDEAQKDISVKEKIPVSYVKKSNWLLNILSWTVPFILPTISSFF